MTQKVSERARCTTQLHQSDCWSAITPVYAKGVHCDRHRALGSENQRTSELLALNQHDAKLSRINRNVPHTFLSACCGIGVDAYNVPAVVEQWPP